MRVMIDTNILDHLDADIEALDELINRRDILLLVTPAQESEVAAIPDMAKRDRLQGIMAQLCRRLAIPSPPRFATVPVSDSRVGVKPTNRVLMGQARTADGSIIAAAVAAGCDLLVSEDVEVLDKALAAGLRAMDWRLFLDRVVFAPRRKKKQN